MISACSQPGVCLSRVATSLPSRSGRPISRKTNSGFSFLACSSAALPLVAYAGECPMSNNSRKSVWAVSRSSSTTSTRFPLREALLESTFIDEAALSMRSHQVGASPYELLLGGLVHLAIRFAGCPCLAICAQVIPRVYVVTHSVLLRVLHRSASATR